LAASEELQRAGLTVARIVAADDHPGARAPSFLVTLDLGRSGGRRVAAVPAGGYDRGALVGRQVVCAVEGDEAVVVGAHSHAGGFVLVGPDREVEEGSLVA
jgi:tRNA-binding EMAP/Myf-like protein